MAALFLYPFTIEMRCKMDSYDNDLMLLLLMDDDLFFVYIEDDLDETGEVTDDVEKVSEQSDRA
jgi:hypothetical protein